MSIFSYRWVQNDVGSIEERTACLYSALKNVARMHPEAEGADQWSGRVREAISKLFPERVQKYGDAVLIHAFNDNPATTLEDVQRVLDEAQVPIVFSETRDCPRRTCGFCDVDLQP